MAIPPDRFENNDTQATATNWGTLSGYQYFPDLTIDAPGDEDWYRVSATTKGILVGTFFSFDPESNILLEIIDQDGNTHVVDQLNEFLFRVPIPRPGNIFLRLRSNRGYDRVLRDLISSYLSNLCTGCPGAQ